MKTTVKTYWICMLLMLTYSISCNAIDFTKVDGAFDKDCKISTSLSSASNIENIDSTFTFAQFIGSSDVELGSQPITEVYSSNQQRLRRISEDNMFLRHIFLILSNCENLLVQRQTKLYYSDKASYALSGSAYYIFTLRRILI